MGDGDRRWRDTQQSFHEQSLQLEALAVGLQQGGLLLDQVGQQGCQLGRRLLRHAPNADHSSGSCSWMATARALRCDALPPTALTLSTKSLLPVASS